MFWKSRKAFVLLATFFVVSFFVGCAGIIPSSPSVKEVSKLTLISDIPKSVSVKSIHIDGYSRLDSEIQKYMILELRRHDFIVDEENPRAVFIGNIKWSSHNISGTDIVFYISLENTEDGRVIWSSEIHRDYDVYSSLNDGIKHVIDESLNFLMQNIRTLKNQW